MRIRSLSAAFMAGMGILAVAGAAGVAFQEWLQLQAAREAEQIIHVLGSANHFVEVMALERGMYNQVAVSQDERRQALVTERVAATDAVFQRTESALSTMNAALAKPSSEPLRAAHDRVRHARMQMDDFLAGRTDQQPDIAAENLVSQFVEAARILDGAIVPLDRALSLRDPRLGQLLQVSRLSNELREAAGQRSTILSRFVATEQRQDVATVTRLAELTGAIQSTWERLQTVVRQAGSSPKAEAAIAHIRSSFMEIGELTYDGMMQAAREGAPPNTQFLPWRSWTVGMLNNIVVGRDAPVEQALDDVKVLEQAAELQFFAALAIALAAVAIAFGAAFFVQRRIVLPIAGITSALERVGQEGHDDAGDPFAAQEHRKDEIGSLSRALKQFQRRTQEIQELHQRFDAALKNLPLGLTVFDAEQNLVVCNERFCEIYGLRPDAVRPGTSLRAILQQRQASGTMPVAPEAYMQTMELQFVNTDMSESTVQLPNGKEIAIRRQRLPNGGWLTAHDDITARRHAEAKIAHLAHHDALTDLPNRVLFRQQMDHALARAPRGDEVAVLCLDLDEFKSVNDTLGHPVGDLLLQAVAERLRECVRDSDTVARLGGDEFAILQIGAPQPTGASDLARRVLEIVSEPYVLNGHQVAIGTSIGIALAPTDTTDPDQLLKSADLALYRAKGEGRGRFRFFETEMDARMQARRGMEIELRKALATGQFELYYQPLINLQTNTASGFEALLRWKHPERGMIPPADFIPLAEEIGLIIPIGAWVLREACAEAARWPDHLRVSVNLSPVQFKSGALAATVVSALAAAGLSASRLELEITESVLLQENEANLQTLHQLRELGIRISLDDFGTGYSSLSYLRSFPFDNIKIDQSFVRELSTRSDCAAIVRAVADLGSTLGMATTAEGIETEQQLDRVRERGCTEAQGYLFSRPVPASQLAAFFGSVSAGSAVA